MYLRWQFREAVLGKDLHITRKADWSDAEGAEIGLEEWLNYVGSDKSMLLLGEDAKGAPVVRDETLAVWTGWSGRVEGQREAWMWLSHGNVMARDADGALRRKMFLIADGLGAKLQGDGGEVYNSIGEVDRADRAKKWWKFW
jgi:hypothetical protein